MNQQINYADLIDVLRRDRVRRTRGKRFAAFLGKLATSLLTGFLTALLCGWTFMLAVGVIHHEWLPGVPTLGYWWAVAISALVRSGLGIPSAPTKKDGAA